jgi:epoxyqueuosine reductase
MTSDAILNNLLKKALDLGASIAGTLRADQLEDCPSARAAGPQGFRTFTGTIVVLGLYHDPEQPEMDWWEEGRGTPGDRMLRSIARELSVWLHDKHGIAAHDIPYQVYDGGIYLKDAAVMAGLGCIGRNNLVLTPEYGPRVRFRALWVDIDTKGQVRSGRKPPLRDAVPPECTGKGHVLPRTVPGTDGCRHGSTGCGREEGNCRSLPNLRAGLSRVLENVNGH